MKLKNFTGREAIAILRAYANKLLQIDQHNLTSVELNFLHTCVEGYKGPRRGAEGKILDDPKMGGVR